MPSSRGFEENGFAIHHGNGSKRRTFPAKRKEKRLFETISSLGTEVSVFYNDLCGIRFLITRLVFYNQLFLYAPKP